jgi:hypothetical protein
MMFYGAVQDKLFIKLSIQNALLSHEFTFYFEILSLADHVSVLVYCMARSKKKRERDEMID